MNQIFFFSGREGLHVRGRDLQAVEPAEHPETQVADPGVLRAHGRRVRKKYSTALGRQIKDLFLNILTSMI